MSEIKTGEILEGKVTGITAFGAFVELPNGGKGMIHISEVAPTYVKEIRDHLTEGQTVTVKVVNIDEKGKIGLSIKKALAPAAAPPPPRRRENTPPPAPARPGPGGWQPKPSGDKSFEDLMAQFKQQSDEKISDLKRTQDGRNGAFTPRPRSKNN